MVMVMVVREAREEHGSCYLLQYFPILSPSSAIHSNPRTTMLS